MKKIILILLLIPLSILCQEYQCGEYEAGEYEAACKYSDTKKPMTIYPNPTTDYVTVENFERIEVFNIIGRKIGEWQGQRAEIDVSGWATGVYLVKNENSLVLRLIVQ